MPTTRGSRPCAACTAAAVTTFGLGRGADVRAHRRRVATGSAGTAFTLDAPRGARGGCGSATPGRHLVPHALAAAAVAERFGVAARRGRGGARGRAAMPTHRMAVVEAAGGATLIDDTYNALAGLGRRPRSTSSAETPAAAGRRRLRRAGRHAGARARRGAAASRDRGRRRPASPTRLLAVGERGRWIAEGARAAGLRDASRRRTTPTRRSPAVERDLAPGVGDVVLLKASRGIELDRLVDGAGSRRAGDGMTDMLPIVVALLLAFPASCCSARSTSASSSGWASASAIRTDGPEGHLVKAGTPTMGGMLLVLVVMFLAMAHAASRTCRP